MFIYQDLMRDAIANRPAPGSRGRRFISTDTHVEYYDDGTTWQAIPLDAALITSGTLPAARLPNPSASTLGGVESIAAVTHQFLTSISTSGVPAQAALVAADIPNIAESQVTGLTTDLAAKAPLVSPALSGVPTAPTPATSDNSTTLATTAYVKAQPQPFTAVLFWPGTQTKTNLFAFTIPKIGTLSITVTWAANFADSYGTAPGTNATATANIAVKKNGTQFGTISISTSGVFTFTTTSGAAQTAVSGDLITLVNPLDSTLADFGVTLAATRV
jgi:hypothetical protein